MEESSTSGVFEGGQAWEVSCLAVKGQHAKLDTANCSNFSRALEDRHPMAPGLSAGPTGTLPPDLQALSGLENNLKRSDLTQLFCLCLSLSLPETQP